MFDLSHDVKLSCNMGQLVPIMNLDVVPGDRIMISAEALIRFAPMQTPPMHRIDCTIHYFFVPNRIIWPKWEEFITNTKTAGLLPAVPTLTIADQTDWLQTRLHDYLGIPPPDLNVTSPSSETFSALPFGAYNKIYNDYYRDQNLIPKVQEVLLDGGNLNSNFPLQNRAWEHDYFTSSLPFAQKGDSVDLPLGNITLNNALGTGAGIMRLAGVPGSIASAGDVQIQSLSGELVSSGSPANEIVYDPNGTLQVDPTTINDFRRAMALQSWLEKAARGGTRYTENILVNFGVRSSDARLQRPEYITGVKTPVVISEVLNTTGTTAAPQGDMAGHGIAVLNSNRASYYCEEHGYIIGIMSIMPKTAYQQGIERHFLRTDPTDYYWPDFANLGEQEVINKEIFAYQPLPANTETFGYTPRYSEYKYMNNRVAGEFRSTLNNWHMGRIFAVDAPPALDADFVTANPTHRIFAVTDPLEDKMWCHVYNKIKALRPMPKFGTPSTL